MPIALYADDLSPVHETAIKEKLKKYELQVSNVFGEIEKKNCNKFNLEKPFTFFLRENRR